VDLEILGVCFRSKESIGEKENSGNKIKIKSSQTELMEKRWGTQNSIKKCWESPVLWGITRQQKEKNPRGKGPEGRAGFSTCCGRGLVGER